MNANEQLEKKILSDREFLEKLGEAVHNLSIVYYERGLTGKDLSKEARAKIWASHDAYDYIDQVIWWFLNSHEKEADDYLEQWLKIDD